MNRPIVLVTGADGGLGSFVTKAFLDAGATVIGTSRKIQQSDFSSSNFTAIPAGISTGDRAQSLIDQVGEHFGKLDVLAHTFGGFAARRPVVETDDATFHRMSISIHCFILRLSGHPNPANEGHLKTGQ